MKETILKLEHMSKVFPGVIALNDVSMEVRRGDIHALVGENGAGKSTMIKTLTGFPVFAFSLFYGQEELHFSATD